MLHEQNDKKINSTKSGNIGEHYVVAKLNEKNYIATLVERNTDKIDILVCNESITKFAAVQVKTMQDSNKFTMGQKGESIMEDKIFYIFVNLNRSKTGQSPDYYVVKSKIVAEFIKDYHQKWITQPGKRVQHRKDSSMRMFCPPDIEKYKDKFETLGLD